MKIDPNKVIEAVKQLQRALNLPDDGIFGYFTALALGEFYEKNFPSLRSPALPRREPNEATT